MQALTIKIEAFSAVCDHRARHRHRGDCFARRLPTSKPGTSRKPRVRSGFHSDSRGTEPWNYPTSLHAYV